MAEFSDMDGSQGNTNPGWWSSRSRQAPIGSGMSSAYGALVGALEQLSNDRCFEYADNAANKTRALRDTAAGLPLIKSGIKPNKNFFTALENCYGQCKKIAIDSKSERQSEKQRDDTISGKGNEGGDRSKDWAGING